MGCMVASEFDIVQYTNTKKTRWIIISKLIIEGRMEFGVRYFPDTL